MVATVIQEIELDYPIVNGSFPISLLIVWQTHIHKHKCFDFRSKCNFKKLGTAEALLF